MAKLVVSRYVDVSIHLRRPPDDGVLDPDRLGQLHLQLLPLPPQHDPPVVKPLRLVTHLNRGNGLIKLSNVITTLAYLLLTWSRLSSVVARRPANPLKC